MGDTKISRRSAVKGFVAAGLGAAAAALTDASNAKAAHPHAYGEQSMIIRHGEKPNGTGAPYGITAGGVEDPSR
jgi:hypothetical protein